MRRGFTLIELLVIVAIVGIMVTVGVAGLASGQGAARVRGAARDVVASIRHARSEALVSQKPTVITFSNESSEGGPVARVTIDSAKIFNAKAVTWAKTLEGETVSLTGDDEPKPTERVRSHTVNGESAVVEKTEGGESIEDILFAPVSDEVVRGIRLKVVTGSEAETAVADDAPQRSSAKLSVFSTADYLVGRFRESKEKEKSEREKNDEEASAAAEAAAEDGGPVSIVWQVNGRAEPHSVWVYREGTSPEQGLLIRVDRFGGVKVLRGDGREDEDL